MKLTWKNACIDMYDNQTGRDPVDRGGGSMIWFFVGGLVVAVVVVGYFVMNDGIIAKPSAPSGGNVSIAFETALGPAADAAPVAAPTDGAPEPAAPVD